MKEDVENTMPENDSSGQHVEKQEIIRPPWYNCVILTRERKKNNVLEITGLSVEIFDNGDIIHDNTQKYSQQLKIIKELERRDAKGVWENDANKNLWFKAIAKPTY